ncbi:MAG: protoheme IX farnesyltransferase [Ignavibacteriales bacterium]|nr:MAG: protoheme IX farnesyltransferase [Ignavibacteriaceae bacterium]MBW7873566.1 protoheme IX farnesyltransferase [Ignavibacteria bacterium]MCZ2143797.1 protoheme IX farnesyltransferase [Ignavibacteriales bacterium]OQY70076.1 MAG: hypothetical protein B6D45_11850 [Ignavibacteriales bacterium UTCHB3]MBV6445932.1 Protoheme IX farnesyltransferase [Ignavibacteriaceae bacterium]
MKTLLDLVKIRITALATITTSFGYIMYSGALEWGVIPPSLGIFLVACSSAAINQYQDSDIDGMMKRTRNRPIPSGKLTKAQVLLIAAFLAVAGSAILLIFNSWLEMSLALLAMVWYNVIYTPMKRRNPFAVVPGSIIGSIPPVVGWIAAGGDLFAPESIFLAFFFFIWQIPHFWLLLLFLDKDYTRTGIPTIKTRFNEVQLARITFAWIFATAISGLLFPVFHLVNGWAAVIVIVASVGALVFYSVRLLRYDTRHLAFKKAFMGINFFVLFLVIVISIDKLMPKGLF